LYAYKNDLGKPTTSRAEATNRFIADVDQNDTYKVVCDKGYYYAITLDASEGLAIKIVNASTGSVLGGPYLGGVSIWLCPASGTYYLVVEKTGLVGSTLYNLFVEWAPQSVIPEFQTLIITLLTLVSLTPLVFVCTKVIKQTISKRKLNWISNS